MPYLKQYRSFINSHYFSEGVRMTVGVLIPAFVMNSFGQLQIGITLCLGALFVSFTDGPGPVHHRRHGMLAATLSIFVVSLVATAAKDSVLLTGALLAVAGFLFSMFAVFGPRPGSVGVSALVVLTLHMDATMQPQLPILQQALTMAAGGAWYTAFSLLLYTFNPYRLARQTLGEWIQIIAVYLRIRSQLYAPGVNFTDTHSSLLQQQAQVQEKQTQLRELLLKTRMIVKESTETGRLLLITFIDMSDLFEKLITSYSRYSYLHKEFEESDILDDLHRLIKDMSFELEEVGLSLKSGQLLRVDHELGKKLRHVTKKFDAFEAAHLNDENLQAFISLRRILQNAGDIIRQIEDTWTNLRQGVSLQDFDKNLVQKDVTQFADKQPINLSIFRDNLSFDSDVFRHSIRMTVALLTGFAVAHLFDIGHGYWILLTILVILKPAYSLAKKRNIDRLLGTAAGAALGLLILQFITHPTALLVIMVLLMIANFSFMRTHYFLSVMLMTPYILIFFYFLRPEIFNELLKDRIIDTAIGSVIAFVASYVLFPSWEKYKIKPLMIASVEKIRSYFTETTKGLTGITDSTAQRLARKHAFISLANISDAFNRMINEPKYQQKHTQELQQFVVLLHSLVSYIATLGYYIRSRNPLPASGLLVNATKGIEQTLDNIAATLKGEEQDKTIPANEALQQLNQFTNDLVRQRQQEMEEGMDETPTKAVIFEINSIAHQFNLINRSTGEICKMLKQLRSEE